MIWETKQMSYLYELVEKYWCKKRHRLEEKNWYEERKVTKQMKWKQTKKTIIQETKWNLFLSRGAVLVQETKQNKTTVVLVQSRRVVQVWETKGNKTN